MSLFGFNTKQGVRPLTMEYAQLKGYTRKEPDFYYKMLDRGLTVKQASKVLGVSPSCTSRHLAELIKGNSITAKECKDDRFGFYLINWPTFTLLEAKIKQCAENKIMASMKNINEYHLRRAKLKEAASQVSEVLS